jgi:hypothetical protein
MGVREAITKLLMGKVGGPWEGGIRAYHSSPHDFGKFDWSKLRTGEGANSYGAGFYAAENPAVSGQGGQYWQQFLNKFNEPSTPPRNCVVLALTARPLSRSTKSALMRWKRSARAECCIRA